MTTRDAVLRHQDGFDLAHVGRRFPKPRENRIFLVAGGAGYATDTIAFGKLGKRFDDFTRRGLSPIKQGPFGGRECMLTGATLIALLTIAGSPKLDDVPLRCGL